MTNSNGIHRETFRFHKSQGAIVGTSLAMNVGDKVSRGQELTTVEAGILNLCITKEQLRFIRKHGL